MTAQELQDKVEAMQEEMPSCCGDAKNMQEGESDKRFAAQRKRHVALAKMRSKENKDPRYNVTVNPGGTNEEWVRENESITQTMSQSFSH